MMPFDRAEIMNDLTEAQTTLAMAGIAAAHGELSPAAMHWHLCARRYGEELATEAFGLPPSV